uniref:ribosomal protein S8 n=1 Tax=Asplenium castaneoviride TaxID=2601855 RepID=UPI0023AA62B0|nr:ribosomal protein S8 [Asplenium castaneoviride]YP_010702283.1 ribosomal protein S8 [Asplenium ruprechtii]WCL38461.1 ribosomal protein S8 [Asplenium castaneoviride]WCL38549.1 ribosomal protein S8 [Asplenium castaneoviride]WCL38637.1 ribosomal protein S8 [Asplenium ruprechtii]
MNNDSLSAALTAIRNANTRKKSMIRIPATKITARIVQISVEEGFIKSAVKYKNDKKEFLDVSLKYFGKKKDPSIAVIRRISKPGLRVYSDHREIPKILGGMGIAILPTSHGLLTDREARYNKIGGEISCHIW